MVRACSKTRQPVRRPALQVRPLAPCFAVWSPGRGNHATLYSANVPWRPPRPIFSAAPMPVMMDDDAPESRRAHRARLMGAAETHLPQNRPQIIALGPTIYHLTSESWSSSLQQDYWAGGKDLARTSPLTARRRVALAPISCGSSFRGTSSRATCRIRPPSCSGETCMGTRATFRPHFGHLIPSPFRDLLRKRKGHCAPEYAPRARSPIG